MKQKDIALIVVIALFGAVISLVISNMLFSSPAKRQEQVEIVQPLTADFPTPDKRYFNKDSFDPTQIIRIGQEVSSEAAAPAQ